LRIQCDCCCSFGRQHLSKSFFTEPRSGSSTCLQQAEALITALDLAPALTLKDVIQEKFGDGIMSAIDFTLDVDKVEDPAGDRVKVTMCGKFLAYKTW
jgi:hypothetical protein